MVGVQQDEGLGSGDEDDEAAVASACVVRCMVLAQRMVASERLRVLLAIARHEHPSDWQALVVAADTLAQTTHSHGVTACVDTRKRPRDTVPDIHHMAASVASVVRDIADHSGGSVTDTCGLTATLQLHVEVQYGEGPVRLSKARADVHLLRCRPRASRSTP